MIHFSKELRDHSGKVAGALADTFFPQTYLAISIHDFVDNRKEVQPTRSLIPIALFYYELACIAFINVNFRLEKNGRPTLYDLTDAIEVIINRNSSRSVVVYERGLEKLLVPEGRLFMAGILYKPKTDQAFLYSVEPYGPPAPEGEEKELLPHSLQPEYT